MSEVLGLVLVLLRGAIRDRSDLVAENVLLRHQFAARVVAGEAIPPLLALGADLRPVFAGVHYLALVCDDAVIERRLRARPASRTTLAADFEAYLRTQLWVDRECRAFAAGDPPIALVDTSDASVDSVADAVASWVRGQLPVSTP